MRSVLSGLFASAIALVGVCLLLEAGVRVFGVGNDATAMPHPWTGWVLIPGKHAEMANEDPTQSRRVRIDYNALGMRDVDRIPAKRIGTYRVLMLGDSYLEGVAVPFDSLVTR